MPGLRTLVVEPLAGEAATLHYLLQIQPRVSAVDVVADLDTALARMQHQAADGLFVCLTSQSRNQLLHIAGLPWRPNIIATGPSSQYAHLAFDIGAIDYLVKPFTVDSVTRAVERLAVRGCEHVADPRSYRVQIQREGVLHYLDPRDIAVVEADGDYTRILSSQGTDLCRQSLNALQAMLEPLGFVRVHRSYLVSAARVEQLSHQAGHLVVRVMGLEVPVARRHVVEVRARLT